MNENLVKDIVDYWGFAGIEPTNIHAISPFGHLVISDIHGRFWYLDPEVRTLEQIAENGEGMIEYMNRPEVSEIWLAEALVERAKALIGAPPTDRCYALKPLAMLAGDYASDDFWHTPVSELIRFSGSIEQQTQGFPDGQVYEIKVTE